MVRSAVGLQDGDENVARFQVVHYSRLHCRVSKVTACDEVKVPARDQPSAERYLGDTAFAATEFHQVNSVSFAITQRGNCIKDAGILLCRRCRDGVSSPWGNPTVRARSSQTHFHLVTYLDVMRF